MTALVIALLGCSQPVAGPERVAAKSYFDLKSYFDGESQRLSGLPKAKKIVTADGKTEERILDSHDFGEDLKIFSNADINRPAWSDKYVADSVFNEQGKLVRLDYATDDTDLRTKKITIEFEEGNVAKVFIENTSITAIADTRQLLTYLPGKGYTIESRQKVAFSDDKTFVVEVQFFGN